MRRHILCCKCINSPVFVAPVEVKELTCITFSNGWNNLAGTRGVWVKSSNVKVISGCTTAGGNCGFFDSSLSSMMSIPLFANAYDSYSELSISLWFKRTAGVSGKQGLVGNGDCGASSSIGLMSEDENLVSVLMKNSANVDFTATGLTVSIYILTSAGVGKGYHMNVRIFSMFLPHHALSVFGWCPEMSSFFPGHMLQT